MNLLAVTYPPDRAHEAWGSAGMIFNRRDMLVLIWHLLVALLIGRRWVRFDWSLRGDQGGWYRIAQPVSQMQPNLRVLYAKRPNHD